MRYHPASLPQKGDDKQIGKGSKDMVHLFIYSSISPIVAPSLIAQLVKNPPAMQETLVRSLGWEDPLEKGKATHSNILAWRIP